MKEANRRGLLLLILLVIIIFTGCELDEVEEERVYLRIEHRHSYGAEVLQPGRGSFGYFPFRRFVYDKGAIADIELEINEGYQFTGWRGEHGELVIETEEENTYSIKMDGDKEIVIGLEMEEFKLLDIEFDEIKTVEPDKIDEIVNIPHNLTVITLKFNNQLSSKNRLQASIFKENNHNNNDNNNENNDNDENDDIRVIDTDNIEMNRNIIRINLRDWRGRIFDDEENLFEFGEDYQFLLENETEDHIFDVNNKEIAEDDISFTFKVEEPYPERPGNLVADLDMDKVELSWHRSKSIAKTGVNKYVEDYIIYKSENVEDLLYIDDKLNSEETEKIEVNLKEDLGIDDPGTQSVIRFKDDDVDLTEKDYYYRVKALNEYDNKSRASKIAGTGY